MQSLIPESMRQIWAQADFDVGSAAVYLSQACKEASDAVTVHALSGRLFLSQSGWVLLSVPNALVRGAFDALIAPGAELPLKDGTLNAHITVMSPEDVATIGGPQKITERGHMFSYTLGPVKEVEPAGWKDMSRVWFIEVASTALKDLRRSYGLTPLPKDNQHEFHITLAVRRKNVLRNNDVSKFDTNHGSETTTERVGKAAAAYAEFYDPAVIFEKLGNNVLKLLQQAKRESDRGNYREKHRIMKMLNDSHPGEFIRDSTKDRFAGLTHKPTGFKIHVPTSLLPG